jgi:F-type H+-transporting ATPase subunit epsilon
MAAVTRLTIVTPTAKKFEGDAELVIAPGAAGDLGALAQHAPLLTTLRIGAVKANVVRSEGEAVAGRATVGETAVAAGAGHERVEFAVDGGFMEVLPDRVIVLTDAAVSRGEVDVEATRAELKRAEEALAQKRGADDDKERHAVAWAQAKLEVAHRPS